jgi:hypothetical protein
MVSGEEKIMIKSVLRGFALATAMSAVAFAAALRLVENGAFGRHDTLLEILAHDFTLRRSGRALWALLASARARNGEARFDALLLAADRRFGRRRELDKHHVGRRLRRQSA